MSGYLKELAVVGQPHSRLAEAYRALLASLLMLESGEPLRVLGIASPGLEVSRVSVACNLAALLALGGARTLVVDADLRRPAAHSVCGTSGSPGVFDCLQGAPPEPLVASTELEGLYVLAAGAPGRIVPDVVAFQRASPLLAGLFEAFDRVVLILPPVLGASEGLVCARWAQGVILVVEAYRTKRDLALRAKELLGMGQVKLIGAVLANARDASTPLQY